MAKTPKTTAVVPVGGKNDNVVVFAQNAPQMLGLALSIGVDLTGSLQERANLAAEHMNRSQRHMLASGLLLSSIKAECDHGTFTEIVKARGFEVRAAQRAMLYAEFIASQPNSNAFASSSFRAAP